LESHDPGTGEVVFSGNCVDARDVSNAATLAHQALEDWEDTAVLERIAILNRYADALRAQRDEVALIISRETGKPLWESLTEVDAMVNKVGISVEAFHDRRRPTERQQAGAIAATRYKPMGVMGVFGPFNMPGHLPNGHIVPALLAGNTVVFKPSELTPGVAVKMVQLLQSAGVPGGVINLVQGGRDIGAALATDPQVDGILFTGSVAGGLAISRALVDQPNKIIALEMGGNNPLIVWEPADLDAAAYLTIQSAYLTSGQRCSCARRLIVSKSPRSRAFVDRLVAMIETIRVGHHSERPEPFMGSVISEAAADRMLDAQRDFIARGAKPLVEMSIAGPRRTMLRPGLIDVSNRRYAEDTELFGPLLQVSWIEDFDDAIGEANETKYGLAAGLFSDDAALWERFYRKIRAGVVYWNRQTTGGSSHLPFGGVGLSGNHRPSGYWAVDYCSYPVASMEVPTLVMPAQKTPGIG
ncbi:MAG: succinylglutamate-semialdehyde dehydrogenase, partial [Phycisphaerales bacterium]|nr:succinylglutamate-semialdehyde dehydrogenase [Phycisphaerales bacterium]